MYDAINVKGSINLVQIIIYAACYWTRFIGYKQRIYVSIPVFEIVLEGTIQRTSWIVVQILVTKTTSLRIRCFYKRRLCISCKKHNLSDRLSRDLLVMDFIKILFLDIRKRCFEVVKVSNRRSYAALRLSTCKRIRMAGYCTWWCCDHTSFMMKLLASLA